MSKEKMSPSFAVFNNHVNDAGDKALALMEEFFPLHYEEVKKADEDGIMSIFNSEPTKAALIYVAMVTALVNEELDDD